MDRSDPPDMENEKENLRENESESNDNFENVGNVKVITSEKCPVCKKACKKVLMHIEKSKFCKQNISETDLSNLKEVAKKIERKLKNARQNKSRKPKQAKGNKINQEIPKIRNTDLKLKSREQAAARLERYRQADYQKVKDDQNRRKAKSRANKKSDKLEAKSQDQNDASKKLRVIDNGAAERLRAFREATMIGPDFICVSCHGKMFQSSVQKFTNRLMNEINEKISLDECIADLNLFTRIEIVDSRSREPDSFAKEREFGDRYICKTCLKYLRKGKLPPSSVMNNLQLHETDAELKEQDLELTELEAALISKNIIFQKIFQLPRSRWTGLKDRIINVPITDDSIMNTLVQLPRTPTEAGLIGISLKRKKEMKNDHIKQMINPDRVFRMLNKLKMKGNPHYQNLHTPESFIRKCAETDKEGLELMFDDIQEEFDAISLNCDQNSL